MSPGENGGNTVFDALFGQSALQIARETPRKTEMGGRGRVIPEDVSRGGRARTLRPSIAIGGYPIAMADYCGGCSISIAQTAAGRMYMEGR